jgi:hypothetical protein
MTTVSTGHTKGNFSPGEGEYFLNKAELFFVRISARYCYSIVTHYFTFWNIFCKSIAK